VLSARCWLHAAFLLISFSAAAIAQERELGLKVGASIATLDRESSQTGDDPYSSRTGLTGGAYALLPLHDRFGVQFEMLSTEKGGSLPLHDPMIVQGSVTTRFKFHYLDLPILARVRGPRIGPTSLHAFAGPTLSMRLSAKQQTVFDFAAPAGFELDLGSEMKRFDLGLTFGGAVQIGRRLSFDARYTQGFNDVLVEEGGSALSNRGLLVTAGVRVF
jgi:hypothetical protein